eukprot:3245572-Pyramimonas_sp.AAC.1
MAAATPARAFVHLASLPNLAGQTLGWPGQIFVNIAQLVFKSEQSDRPITLTQGVHRAWPRVTLLGRSRRRPQLSQGSRAETNKAGDSEPPTVFPEVLWDLEKFYDAIDPEQPWHVGAQVQHPLTHLFLGLSLHFG